MKYLHLILYRFFDWLWELDRSDTSPYKWLDNHFAYRNKYGGFGSEIKMWVFFRHIKLYAKCEKEGTL